MHDVSLGSRRRHKVFHPRRDARLGSCLGRGVSPGMKSHQEQFLLAVWVDRRAAESFGSLGMLNNVRENLFEDLRLLG